ncbi:MAG: hypothetical protein M1133_08840 [Armatimonadetes bacterium]|nr:hypothetical protein [Armatimonadota bacterium]
MVTIGILALCVVYVAIAQSYWETKAKVDANQFLSPWDMSYAPRETRQPSASGPVKQTRYVQHDITMRVATADMRSASR